MATDPQHLLKAPTPFYRRRWFWGVVIGGQIAASLVIFLPLLKNPNIDILSILFAITGGWVFTSLGWLAEHLVLPLTVAYFIVLLFLIFQTFRNTNVKMIFPIIYLITALISTDLAYNFWMYFS